MKIYSLHQVTDGKWKVCLHIRGKPNYVHSFISRPDIRDIINKNYDTSPEELAKILLTTVLDCESVSVKLLCGPGVYMEKEEVSDE